MTVALIPGFAAREVAVAALGTVYALGEGAPGVLGATLAHHWSIATGLSFLAWYVFAPQCASTFGVVKRETNSWRWPLVMLAYMTALAYGAAYIVYHSAVALGAG
jgi:ferrous iron transport protein B